MSGIAHLARAGFQNCDEPLCRGPSHTTQRGIRTIRVKHGCARDWGVDPGRYLVPMRIYPGARRLKPTPRKRVKRGARRLSSLVPKGPCLRGSKARPLAKTNARAIMPRGLTQLSSRARFVACRT